MLIFADEGGRGVSGNAFLKKFFILDKIILKLSTYGKGQIKPKADWRAVDSPKK